MYKMDSNFKFLFKNLLPLFLIFIIIFKKIILSCIVFLGGNCTVTSKGGTHEEDGTCRNVPRRSHDGGNP